MYFSAGRKKKDGKPPGLPSPLRISPSQESAALQLLQELTSNK